MPSMPSRTASLASAVLVSASLSLAAVDVHAAPPAASDPPSESDERPVEGPQRPSEDPGWQAGKKSDGAVTPPAPKLEPGESGIEFAVPPPETETEEPEPTEEESPLAATWPDPGMAPNDGNSMIVLSSVTLGLTAATFGIGLKLGLDYQVPLQELLPATIIPTAITLAFVGGGLFLGISRAQAYRRWEIGYRVVGHPQGGGLKVAGSFAFLGALGGIPAGIVFLQNGDVSVGAPLLAIGSASAIAVPIFFVIGSRRARDYARTGGWHRRPIPPIPGSNESRLQITPLVAPTLGGFTVGAAGRF